MRNCGMCAAPRWRTRTSTLVIEPPSGAAAGGFAVEALITLRDNGVQPTRHGKGTAMAGGFQVKGANSAAPFTLTVHRGDGMALLAMNWRMGKPPPDFVGFGMQYVPPGATKPLNVDNRITFAGTPDFGKRQPSLKAPFQKWRWVHFPSEADQSGPFHYIVTPVFMDANDRLTSGEAQTVDIELARLTYPDLNVGFTRGFVASQAFVDRFGADAIPKLLPGTADEGLGFTPSHPKAALAYDWMGFEARRNVLDVLDQALADTSTTARVVAYDLNLPELLQRLEQLGTRLRVIIDNSGTHGASGSAENAAEARLVTSAGRDNVQRQHVGGLQHNKTIVITGANLNLAVCGSTNFSWRGFYVQNNNAIVLSGATRVQPFADAFEQYWNAGAAAFQDSACTAWSPLTVTGVDAQVTFSPHDPAKGALQTIADDILTAKSSVLYSLAFLYQTNGPVRDSITTVTENPALFVAGISDRAVGGINVQTPDGNRAPVYPGSLAANVPVPFSAEPTGGGGVRLHHKFVVIDFDTPDARVYMGSYNFSGPADHANGENLLCIRDRRVATSYAIEATRIFDHYEFRVNQANKATAVTELALSRPPRKPGDVAWFEKDYTQPHRILDRTLYS
jgi:phosphatidylserine/phosphatidylglycerophosphate/cardiolipin synthase-like enzyme